MTKSLTRTAITNMALIISDAQALGYQVVGGRPLESEDGPLTYAFYSLHRHSLFDEPTDCFFTAYINGSGKVIYKPLSQAEYHADEV